MEDFMRMPAGMLLNTATNRYHPIVFRWGAAPSGPLDGADRYKSKGHHTNGFDTIEEAKAHMETPDFQKNFFDTGAMWNWDGQEIPAIVTWFHPESFYKKEPT